MPSTGQPDDHLGVLVRHGCRLWNAGRSKIASLGVVCDNVVLDANFSPVCVACCIRVAEVILIGSVSGVSRGRENQDTTYNSVGNAKEKVVSSTDLPVGYS